VVLATIVTKFPELLNAPVIQIPDLWTKSTTNYVL
jgi:hypothetical protein